MGRTFEACALGARLLIGLSALLIVAMPWTEYYWQFDNFLRGGQDFEFGLLSTLMVFCLVLVLIRQNKQGVTFLFALRRWLSLVFQYPDPMSPSLSFRMFGASHAESPPHPSSGICDLPLRI